MSCWLSSRHNTIASLTTAFAITGRVQGGRGRAAVSRRLEPGNRRQEAAGRRQAPQDRRREAAGRRQNAVRCHLVSRLAQLYPLQVRRAILRCGGASVCTMDLFQTRQLRRRPFPLKLRISHNEMRAGRPRSQQTSLRLFSAQTRQSTMVASQITAGCRSCQSRSRN